MKTLYNYSEQEAAGYAEEAAKGLEFRTFEDGCSRDERRASTEPERALLEKAICAALWAIRAGYDADSAKATAEFFVLHGRNKGMGWRDPHINTYGSVYIPVCEFLERHKAEIKEVAV